MRPKMCREITARIHERRIRFPKRARIDRRPPRRCNSRGHTCGAAREEPDVDRAVRALHRVEAAAVVVEGWAGGEGGGGEGRAAFVAVI